MQTKKHIRGVLRMGIFLSLGIQILFGLIWAMANFATVSQFESSSLLLEGIHNFIQSNLVLCVLVYLIQLAAAYMAGFYMLGGFGVQGGYKIFGTLALLTFQPALQCHLSVLPNSLRLSLGMFLVGWVLRIWKKSTKRIWYISASACVLGVLFIVLANSTHTMEEVLVKRFCWPVMVEDFHSYPETFKEEVGVDLLFYSMKYPDSLEEKLFPAMDELFEGNQRKALYREMIGITLKNHGGGIVKRAFWDVLGYHVPSLVLLLQMQGRGAESMSGVNYALFSEQAPVLSKYLVRWEGIACIVCLFATIGLWVLAEKKKINVLPTLFMIVGLELVVMYYWLYGAGRMDYKNGLILSMVLQSLCIKALAHRKEEKEC